MNKRPWDNLSIKEKAELIRLYTENGFKSRREIIDDYNSREENLFDDGGNLFSGEDGPNWMERVADNAREEFGLQLNRPLYLPENKYRKSDVVTSVPFNAETTISYVPQEEPKEPSLFSLRKLRRSINTDMRDAQSWFDELSPEQQRRAIEVGARISSGPNPQQNLKDYVSGNIPFGLRRISTVKHYIYTGEGDPITMRLNPYGPFPNYGGVFNRYGLPQAFNGDLIDAAFNGVTIHPEIGKQLDTDGGNNFGIETQVMLHAYPEIIRRNAQFIETQPVDVPSQEGIESIGIIGGGHGNFRTSNNNILINNQGFSLEGGARNDSLFVRAADIQDWGRGYRQKWMDSSEPTWTIDALNRTVTPIVSQTPWVYYQDLPLIVAPGGKGNYVDLKQNSKVDALYRGFPRYSSVHYPSQEYDDIFGTNRQTNDAGVVRLFGFGSWFGPKEHYLYDYARYITPYSATENIFDLGGNVYQESPYQDVETSEDSMQYPEQIAGEKVQNKQMHGFAKNASEWETNGDLAKIDLVMAIMEDPEGVLKYYNDTYPATKYKTMNQHINAYNMDEIWKLGTKGLSNLVIPRNTKYAVGDEIWNELNNSKLSYAQKVAILANSFHETTGWTAMRQYGNGPASGVYMFEKAEREKYNNWLKQNGLKDSPSNQTRYVVNLFNTKDASLDTAWSRVKNNWDTIRKFNNEAEAKAAGYRSAYNHKDYTTEQAYKDWNSGDVKRATRAFEALFERAGVPMIDRRQRIAQILLNKYLDK